MSYVLQKIQRFDGLFGMVRGLGGIVFMVLCLTEDAEVWKVKLDGKGGIAFKVLWLTEDTEVWKVNVDGRVFGLDLI